MERFNGDRASAQIADMLAGIAAQFLIVIAFAFVALALSVDPVWVIPAGCSFIASGVTVFERTTFRKRG